MTAILASSWKEKKPRKRPVKSGQKIKRKLQESSDSQDKRCFVVANAIEVEENR